MGVRLAPVTSDATALAMRIDFGRGSWGSSGTPLRETKHYFAFTFTCFGLADSTLGRWTVSTPFLHSASMRAASIDS